MSSCKKDVSYTNHIIRDCITRGLSGDDIRLDILGNESRHKTLDSLISHIESKETGKSPYHSLQAVKEQKLPGAITRSKVLHLSEKKTVKCTYCSEASHGNDFNKPLRKEQCPAYRQTCRASHAHGSITSHQFADQKADQTPGKQHHRNTQ